MAKSKHSSNMQEVQNAAKTLYANIRFMSIDDPIRVIVVTSSIPNEGKSVTCIELAKAMAESGTAVLLMEGDMRRQSLPYYLNVHPKIGLHGVLSGEAKPNQAVVPTQVPNVFFLGAEPNIVNPVDVLTSKRYKSLIQALKVKYQYIIIDTPPVGTFVDAAVASGVADGTILVVRPKFTKREDVDTAYEQLVKSGANVLGVCSTFEENTSSEYYYAYYNKNGERVKKGKGKKKPFGV